MPRSSPPQMVDPTVRSRELIVMFLLTLFKVLLKFWYLLQVFSDHFFVQVTGLIQTLHLCSSFTTVSSVSLLCYFRACIAYFLNRMIHASCVAVYSAMCTSSASFCDSKNLNFLFAYSMSSNLAWNSFVVASTRLFASFLAFATAVTIAFATSTSFAWRMI